MAYKITSAVSTNPLTLAEAKSFLRVEHDADNTLIADMITAARAQVEAMTGRALAAHTVEEYFDGWPENGVFELTLSPVTEVASVHYVAYGEALPTTYTPFSSSGNWVADTVSLPARVCRLQSAEFPSLENVPNAVKITYTANATTGSQNERVLSIARMIMRFIITHDYERRTDPVTRMSQNTIRRTEQLIRQIKV